MDIVEGKQVSLAGCIVSLIFSFITLIISGLFSISFSLSGSYEEFKQSYIQGDPSITDQEVRQVFHAIQTVLNVGVYGSIFFLIIGIILLICILFINQTNRKGMSIFIIVVSVLHLFAFRILTFILLLIGGIKAYSKVKNDNMDNVIQLKEEL